MKFGIVVPCKELSSKPEFREGRLSKVIHYLMAQKNLYPKFSVFLQRFWWHSVQEICTIMQSRFRQFCTNRCTESRAFLVGLSEVTFCACAVEPYILKLKKKSFDKERVLRHWIRHLHSCYFFLSQTVKLQNEVSTQKQKTVNSCPAGQEDICFQETSEFITVCILF